jgi:UDP-2,3-diacylglucosamine pyrophosphatase LpxH
VFDEYFQKFYQNVFFQYLDEHSIKHVAFLGDIFDVRKYLNIQTAQQANARIFKPLADRGISTYAMVGNHDSYFVREVTTNSMRALFEHREYPGMTLIDTPTELEFDGTKILVLPWIASSNYVECMEAAKNTKADIAFMHAEFSGFEMYRGNFIEHGMDRSLFSKFDMILSGHYHHKSHQDNVHYLGTQYEITWADYDDSKGFHVFDTETRELEFVINPYKIFHKVYYDDTKWKSLEEALNTIKPELYDGCYVKLVVVQKQNPFWFDQFFDKLEKSNLVNLQIVDDSLILYTEFKDEEGSLDDTLTILNKYIEGLDLEQDKKPIEQLMKGLYDEATLIVEQQ